jgi:aldose 1-epimerase
MKVVDNDPKGTPVQRFAPQRDGINAIILSCGAILQDLRIAGPEHSLILGYPELGPYRTDQNYFGVTAGRVANRIRDGLRS